MPPVEDDLKEKVAQAKAKLRLQIAQKKGLILEEARPVNTAAEDSKSPLQNENKIPAWRQALINQLTSKGAIIVAHEKPYRQDIEKKTLEMLSRFQNSLKKASLEQTDLTKPNQKQLLQTCQLHSVEGCKSCFSFAPNIEISQAEAERGWQSHKLEFEKEAGERQLKASAENLVVIDPKDRDHSHKKPKG